MNNKLLYYHSNNKNNTFTNLCKIKNIPIFKKNILNVILTNDNNDTILIPKIYLTIPFNI